MMTRQEVKDTIIKQIHYEARKRLNATFDVSNLSALDVLYFEKFARDEVIDEMIGEMIDDYTELVKENRELQADNASLNKRLDKIKTEGRKLLFYA